MSANKPINTTAYIMQPFEPLSFVVSLLISEFVSIVISVNLGFKLLLNE